MYEEPFNEKMAESRKFGELKKDGHYSYVSFVVLTLIFEKGWINANFVQGLRQVLSRSASLKA